MLKGRPKILYSKAYGERRKMLLPHLKVLRSTMDHLGLVIGNGGCPVEVESFFYSGKGTEPDLSGAIETVGDLLQEGGVIENDRWIKSWDRSRVRTNQKEDPQTSLYVRPFYE